MNKTFEGTYYVEDGYAGKARPQHFTIDAGELNDSMTDEELIALYDGAAEDAFHREITHYTVGRDEFVAWARKQLEDDEEDEYDTGV